MMNEWEAKREICEMARRMYERGYVAANDGNISVRMGDGKFLCTPTGASMGFLTSGDIATVDDTGKQIAGPKPRTSEILLHLEIFHELPNINAVCHAHPPHATAFAVAGVELPTRVMPEVEIRIGQAPIADYDTPGGPQFAETILPHLRNKANTILLANHGAVTFDNTLEEAYFHLEMLDRYCQILLLAKQVGNVQQLSEPKVKDLLDIKKRMGIEDPRIDGGEACLVAGSDDFLRGFSTVAIPQHTPDSNGHGRGNGIAGAPSQAGQPQPLPPSKAIHPGIVQGRALPASGPMGSSSTTAIQRQRDDEIERLVQLITDQIVAGA